MSRTTIARLLVATVLAVLATAAACDISRSTSSTKRSRSLEVPSSDYKLGASCRIKFLDTSFGTLDDEAYYASKFPMTLACYSSENEAVISGLAKYDPTQEKWTVNFANDEDKRQREKHTRFSSMESTNSRGWMVTIDDFTGEERFRERKLYFCLVHLDKAVCGWGSMGPLKGGLRGKSTSRLLEIVRSIELVD